jgi:hypothetical protein
MTNSRPPDSLQCKISEDELAAYGRAILTGKLTVKQNKSGKWILDLGEALYEWDEHPNYDTLELVGLAQEAFIVAENWEEECSESEPVTTPPDPAAEETKAPARPDPFPQPSQPRLVAALDYAEKRGWEVFPAPPGEKKSYKSAKHSDGAKWGKTRDPKQIRRDFRRWPQANVGIPTGKDNGFWVLEIDTPKGHNVDGNASLRALEEKHGPLPKTLMAESPSGSRHRYFKWPDAVAITNSTSSIAPGIDVRGEGGMVIAPPSTRSDGAYRWLNNNPIADAPQWLIDLAVGKGADDAELGLACEDPDRFKVAPGFEDIPFERLGEGLETNRWWDRLSPEHKDAALDHGLSCIANNSKLLQLKAHGGDGYDTWFGITASVARSGALRAEDIFVKHASKATGADPADALRQKFRDCKKNPRADGFTIGTFIHWAKQCGANFEPWYEASKNNGQGDAQPEKGEASKASLPKLIVNSSDPTATAKDLAALIAKRDDFLFNGHAPIHVVSEADCMPRALEVTTEMVRVLAHEICIPTKRHGGERIRVPLSRDIAQLYLHGLEGSWGLKPFRGITTAPILSDDGTIRTTSGYDARTGLWCHNIPDIIVPTNPTKNDAERALRLLRQLFRTFPFADAARVYDDDLTVEIVDLAKPAGLDESSFHAALLTGVCRQSLELTPGFLCDAPNFSGSGTGKGLLVKAACVIASGSRPSAFTSGHDAEELDKRLTSALTEAHPAVFLDNFNAKNLSSDILASVLTESPAMVRPMGQTKTTPLHTRTFIGITGNSVQIAEDMARRLLNTHLDARLEDPEQRKFAPGFLERVFAERANLLAAALTIWRWGRQTNLTPGKPLGSYEMWAQWCRDPLIALAMRDPVDRITDIKAADPKRRTLIAIFDQWWTSDNDTALKASELAEEVIKLIDDKAFVKTDGSLQYSRQRTASFLARHTDTRVGGYVLTKTMLGPPRKEVAHYKLTRTSSG